VPSPVTNRLAESKEHEIEFIDDRVRERLREANPTAERP